MTKNGLSVAAKNDVREIVQEIVYEIVQKALQQLEKRLVQHFNVVAENLTYDYKGIFKDRTE